ncbi:hypothetical protein E4T42_06735 [Aureobasidium subglaciale]|nr:hypothetical protein E4T42_06735 [Aureobasidium subglaciale]
MESIDCCANETSGRAGSAAFGYWSNANGPELTSTWIIGHPIEGLYTPLDYARCPGLLVRQEPPEMAAISCEPRIEEAEASVTVEINTGIVSDYNIISTLRNASGAWAYPYTQENLTRERAVYGHGFNQDPIQKYMRVNASWGYIFWDTVINSGQEGAWFRFHDQGLNVDLMSYAMLNIANNSPEALLDPSTLTHAANKAFGTFFQHFVCWNITERLGGYAYELQVYSESTYEGFNATPV